MKNGSSTKSSSEILFHLWSDKWIYSIVIIYVGEILHDQIFSEIRRFIIRQNPITMSGHVNKRMVEQPDRLLHNSLVQAEYLCSGSDCKIL